jgi:hypothetical protein
VALTLVRSLPVSAASGLVRVGDVTHVIADDELQLLSLPDDGPAELLRLLPGDLPDDPRARKAIKPDLEALCRWDDGLLALGSGSTAMRHRGCLIRPVPGDISNATAVTTLDLAPLHTHLAARVPALNLEAAAVVGDALLLLQRGNGRGNRSAIVELGRLAVAHALAEGRAWDAALVRGLHFIDLGDRGGAPLAFTDVSPLRSVHALLHPQRRALGDVLVPGRGLHPVVDLDHRDAVRHRAHDLAQVAADALRLVDDRHARRLSFRAGGGGWMHWCAPSWQATTHAWQPMHFSGRSGDRLVVEVEVAPLRVAGHRRPRIASRSANPCSRMYSVSPSIMSSTTR